MDCQEVADLLDAYAIGAAEKGEAKALEEHVADCLRCWRELTEAQRAAALLALAVPLEQASPSLRQRVIRRARFSDRWERLGQWFGRVGRFWPAAAGILAASTAGALSLAIVLQTQMNDLNEENDRLEQQIEAAGTALGHQQQILAMFSAPDFHSVSLGSTPAQPEAVATYYWSEAAGRGAIICNNLPALGPDQAYQLWLLVGDRTVSAGTFTSWNGIVQHTFDFGPLNLDQKPTGIGVTVEPASGSARPSGDFVLFASFPQD